MSRSDRVAVVTESPDDCPRTFDAIEHICEPLEAEYNLTRLSVLLSNPKNGKGATKTEIKNSSLTLTELMKYKTVLLVGNAPLELVTGSGGISKKRGRPFTIDGTTFLPINNPSIIRHDPSHEQVIERDLDLFEDIIAFGGIPEELDLSIRIVDSQSAFEELKKDLTGLVSIDTETNQLYPFPTEKDPDPKIISIGFGTRLRQWILPVNLEGTVRWSNRSIREMLEEITELLSSDCMVVMHNGKFDCLWLWQHYGVQIQMDFDTMLAHYLLDENSRHGLKHLAMKFLGAPDWEVDLDTKKGNTSPEKHIKYLAHDVYYTRKLKGYLNKLLQKDPDVNRVFRELMMPVANLFVEVEYDGVYVNTDKFDEAEKYLRSEYSRALKELKQWELKDQVDARGRPIEFNWGSTKQLAHLLYKHLKLPVIEKTPTGNASCSESVIKRLNHPCTEALLRFRGAKQQLSFFIDGWRPYLHKKRDGYYLHPSFKLHGTVTGRLSCENPNLQQVPRDKRIRQLIDAPDGWVLMELDLSQIELRIAAELAGERAMIEAFLNGVDIHWLTAINEISRGAGLKDLVLDTARTWKQDKTLTYSESIKVLLEMGPDEAVSINGEWKEFRKKAKAVNFGYLYGMWWKKFKDYARDSYGVVISDKEAEASRDTFFTSYPELPSWHLRQKKFATKNGYVTSLTGRKRRLPDAQLFDNKEKQQAAQRQAINSPVQSFANDINLMAALELRGNYGRSVVRICGTVHDAVLVRVKKERALEVFDKMMEIMKGPKLMKAFHIKLKVPIEADGSIGPWGTGVSREKWEKDNV